MKNERGAALISIIILLSILIVSIGLYVYNEEKTNVTHADLSKYETYTSKNKNN